MCRMKGRASGKSPVVLLSTWLLQVRSLEVTHLVLQEVKGLQKASDTQKTKELLEVLRFRPQQM